MSEVRFTKDHEWVRIEGDTATVGISEYAQEQLGDVVFVEVPEVGMTAAKDEQVAVVESVKAASEIFAPVSGEIVEGNAVLADAPETVNSDPYGAGWFFKIKLSDPSELEKLMDEDAYKAFAS